MMSLLRVALYCLLLLLSWFPGNHAFVRPMARHAPRRPWHTGRSCSVLRHPHTLSPALVHDLDLAALLKKIATHAVTARGRRALLTWCGVAMEPTVDNKYASSSSSSRQRRAQLETTLFFRKTCLQLPMAAAVDEARHAYDLVEQAQLVLQQSSKTETALPLPPFYGNDGPPWDSTTTTTTTNAADTDDDEWLELPILEWTLQDILKAEQITERLLHLHAWGHDPDIGTWTPALAHSAHMGAVEPWQRVRQAVAGAVEIVRVKTAMDPTGKSSFIFRLSGDTFPVLRLLQAKEADLAAKVGRQPKLQGRLDALREELQEKQDSIRRGLCRAIADHRAEIDAGLTVMAELDVVFAKAAFGIVHKGAIPMVKQDGMVNVSSFVHPLIADHFHAVPVDLHLAADDDASTPETPRALVISGPNGGGKTLAMKSFGLVCQMVKMGIPIPTGSSQRPTVGFFDNIITAMGDRQSVATGQSTFMAQLSSYAGILESVENSDSESSVLVLLDELGSGTEADGGGAIGQAILEHLLEHSPNCRAVATTHSSRLKATSFRDDRFACATVLLEESAGVRQPTYRLEVSFFMIRVWTRRILRIMYAQHEFARKSTD